MTKDVDARLVTTDGAPVMLEGVRAEGALRGLLLEMSIEQRFRNPADKNVEVAYTFPLPWGAVLLGVEVQLGDKHLTGTIVPKKEAEAGYEEALSQGNASILLERNNDESYSLNLGNLAAAEACTVTLRYAQTLRFEQRGLRLLVPTVIAPRYGDAVRDGGLQPHQAPNHSLTAEYPFDITLRLHGDLARARVASPSHPISVAAAPGELTISLARRGALDREFVLVVDQLTHDSIATLAKDCASGKHVVALASFCPAVPAEASTAIALKLLVDCSGSMAGDSIEAAKRALQAVVGQFAKGDQFSLSRFGSSVQHRSRGLWSATAATCTAGQRWVTGLESDLGGTEMEGALDSTFALAQTVVSDVLLVTDGEIAAIDRTIATAKASGHRLFIVGVGGNPAESHLHRLADATGGACDFVAPGEAVEPAVLRMFARLRTPRLTDLSVAWPGDSPPLWVSPLTAAIFDGDTVNAFALLPSAPVGVVRLLGARSPGAPPREIAQTPCPIEIRTEDTLARMAAATRIQAITGVASKGAATEAQALAVAYRLVTTQTSFLLTHERAATDKSVDMPVLHQVPQMLAAGWGGSGSVANALPSASGVPSGAPRALVDDCRMDSAHVHFELLDWDDDSNIPTSKRHRVPVHFDAAEIPAFLRPQSAARVLDTARNAGIPGLHRPERLSSHRTAIEQQGPQFWSTSEHYHGLTPLGLSQWLREMSKADWPRRFDDLRELGVGASVVDWLELVIAQQQGEPVSEQAVVDGFLHLLAQPEVHHCLLHSLPLTGLLKKAAPPKQDGGTKGTRPTAGRTLLEQLALALDGVTADTWPGAIFAMT